MTKNLILVINRNMGASKQSPMKIMMDLKYGSCQNWRKIELNNKLKSDYQLFNDYKEA